MMTANTHRDYLKILGIISMVYGFVYSIIDRIDYLIQIEKHKSILSQGYPESIMLRIPNLIFCLTLIVAGYFLIHKRKESWYLFNFSFIGILCKYLFTLFLVPPIAFGNILSILGIHLITAIAGLIYINQKGFIANLNLKKQNAFLIYPSLFLLSFVIIFFYGFEDWESSKMRNKEFYKDIIFDSHTFKNKVADTCHYANEFLTIIDTLSDIDKYYQIEILQIDSNSNPTYAERISRDELGVLSDFYFYDTKGRLSSLVKEKEPYNELYDTLIFDYYNNDKLKSITEIYYFFDSYDTMTYHYNYLQNKDTIYFENDNLYNYSYLSQLNDSSLVIEKKQVKGIYSSGNISYRYDSTGKLLETVKLNQKDDKSKSIENYWYNENGFLTKKINKIYNIDSDKLKRIELTMIMEGIKTKPDNMYNP